MLKRFLHRSVRKLERRYGYDGSYLHELVELSAPAFRRFTTIQRLGNGWRADAPRDAWCAAAIAGTLIEDCGPCVQISTDMAIEAGMKPETVSALLSGQPTAADAQLGFDYACALLLATDDLDRLREEIERKWGRLALVAISLRAMSARNYPVLKRAMGHAKTCQKVRIGSHDIVVDQKLKAA